MKEEIMQKLNEYHRNQGIAFLNEKDSLDYFKGLVEILEAEKIKFMFEKSGQCSSLHKVHPETEWEKGWNAAVESMLKYLPQPTLEEYAQASQ